MLNFVPITLILTFVLLFLYFSMAQKKKALYATIDAARNLLNGEDLNQKLKCLYHHHLILDPVLSPSTELAGFCIVIVFYSLPRLAVSLDHMHLLSPVLFYHFGLYLLFPRLFRFSFSSTTAHFKCQSLHYHIYIFFPQKLDRKATNYLLSKNI